MNIHLIIATTLLLIVLLLIIVRPRGLDIAWTAGIGALLAIVFGLLPLGDLVTIFNDTWDATITLIALFLLSQTLDSNGFFRWAALFLARAAHGSGWRLYSLVLLLTFAVVALLANDGAVLMLTPIFAQLFKKIYPRADSRLPFLFAAGLFADAMSIIFIPSNLTNIIVADANGLNFLRFAEWMILPTIFAFLVGATAFALRFHQYIRTPYDTQLLEDPQSAIIDRAMFWIGWIALALLALGYVIGSGFHWPFSLVSGSIALVMLLLVRLRNLRPLAQILRKAPSNILIYALGMFVVITAAYDSHVLAFLIDPLVTNVHAGPIGALLSGSIVALLAAAVNNLPATLISVLVLHVAHTVPHIAIYAIIIGVNIGPKLTPFGSLATLLWLGILNDHDIHISWGHYIRENWWVVIAMLTAAFAGLLLANLLLT